MNHYTQIHNRIKEIAQPLVNTVTQGAFKEVDLSKATIYPLVHSFVKGASFNDGSTLVFDIAVGCWQKRNRTTDYVVDRYEDNSNMPDNMNETLAVINKLWLTLLNDFEDANITALKNPNLTPEYNQYDNGLDGWVIDFSIEIPNTDISLCS